MFESSTAPFSFMRKIVSYCIEVFGTVSYLMAGFQVSKTGCGIQGLDAVRTWRFDQFLFGLGFGRWANWMGFERRFLVGQKL